MSPLEINPQDVKELGIESGDIVELHNAFGSAVAMAYLKPDIGRNQTFMMFGYDNGVVGAFTRLGVHHLRLTGGEPLMRRDLPRLAARLTIGSCLGSTICPCPATAHRWTPWLNHFIRPACGA